jgi:hypothetical protein
MSFIEQCAMSVSAVRGLDATPTGRDAVPARGVIAQVFVFRGILTATELSKFREHRPGRGAAGTTRT